MRTVTAAEARAGDIVADPVVNDQGRTLLPKGTRLSATVLSRLEGWGVHELYVEGEDDTPVIEDGAVVTEADADLLSALEHRFSEWEGDATMMSIKDIARRHLSALRRG